MTIDLDAILPFLFEIVHVKLSDKRMKIVVLKVARQHFRSEFIGVFDADSLPITGPTDIFGM